MATQKKIIYFILYKAVNKPMFTAGNVCNMKLYTQILLMETFR